jgi:hypothetical protein
MCKKLALEALQEIRIKHRWEAMDKENQGYYNLNHRTKHTSPDFSQWRHSKTIIS